MATMICTYVSEISDRLSTKKQRCGNSRVTGKQNKTGLEVMETEMKTKRDGRSWLKESNSENVQAYLPQSLSDNILVSHKSPALQHHSKRQG